MLELNTKAQPQKVGVDPYLRKYGLLLEMLLGPDVD